MSIRMYSLSSSKNCYLEAWKHNNLRSVVLSVFNLLNSEGHGEEKKKKLPRILYFWSILIDENLISSLLPFLIVIYWSQVSSSSIHIWSVVTGLNSLLTIFYCSFSNFFIKGRNVLVSNEPIFARCHNRQISILFFICWSRIPKSHFSQKITWLSEENKSSIHVYTHTIRSDRIGCRLSSIMNYTSSESPIQFYHHNIQKLVNPFL